MVKIRKQKQRIKFKTRQTFGVKLSDSYPLWYFYNLLFGQKHTSLKYIFNHHHHHHLHKLLWKIKLKGSSNDKTVLTDRKVHQWIETKGSASRGNVITVCAVSSPASLRRDFLNLSVSSRWTPNRPTAEEERAVRVNDSREWTREESPVCLRENNPQFKTNTHTHTQKKIQSFYNTCHADESTLWMSLCCV